MTPFDRLMRQYRLEAKLSGRESDRRDQAEVRTWTRDRSKDRMGLHSWTCSVWDYQGTCDCAVTNTDTVKRTSGVSA